MNWNKVFKWIDWLIIAIFFLTLMIGSYKNYPTNSPEVVWLLGIAAVLWIIKTIYRIMGLGSITNMLIAGVVLIAITSLFHHTKFQILLYLALLPVVIVFYGFFKVLKWILVVLITFFQRK